MIKTRVRHYVYTARSKKKNWMEGWRPVGVPDNFYPGPGFLAAHDAIEHLSDKTDFEHEGRAFGATLFGRIAATDPGDRMERNAGNDLGNFMRMRNEAGELVHLRRPPQRWLDYKLPPRMERLLGSMLKQAEESYFSVDIMGIMTIPRENVPREERRVFREAIEKMEGWIRLGYAGAQRVYGANSDHDMWDMLMHTARRIDMHHDDVRPQPGDTLTITVDTRRKHADFKYEKGPDYGRLRHKQEMEVQASKHALRKLEKLAEEFDRFR